MRALSLSALLASAGCTFVPAGLAGRCEAPIAANRASTTVPRVDHHQHLLSEAAREATVMWLRTIDTANARQSAAEPLVDADQLVRMLDDAGIAQALVFSNAYYLSRAPTEPSGEYDRVKAENDWTLAQVQRHPSRLFAACSVNPRRAHAVAEIERCAASGAFRALKMHFDASGVDLTDPTHVASVRTAFAAANRLRLPVVAHLQSEAARFDGANARTFLDEILPAAPDVPVTINHLWGGGLYSRGASEVLAAFSAAMRRGAGAPQNLWFDLAQASMMVSEHEHRSDLVARMREIGLARLLYGSDGPQWSGSPPAAQWDDFKSCMPLTRAELDAIASNVAPNLR